MKPKIKYFSGLCVLRRSKAPSQQTEKVLTDAYRKFSGDPDVLDQALLTEAGVFWLDAWTALKNQKKMEAVLNPANPNNKKVGRMKGL